MNESEHSTPRGNFSWSHPYTFYLKQAGWKNISYETAFFEENTLAKIVLGCADSEECKSSDDSG